MNAQHHRRMRRFKPNRLFRRWRTSVLPRRRSHLHGQPSAIRSDPELTSQSPDAGFGRADAGVGMQISLFVFDPAPQSSHEPLSRQQSRPSMLIANSCTTGRTHRSAVPFRKRDRPIATGIRYPDGVTRTDRSAARWRLPFPRTRSRWPALHARRAACSAPAGQVRTDEGPRDRDSGPAEL